MLVTREAGSGTYGAFEELVMNKELPTTRALRQGSNGAVRQIVAEDAGCYRAIFRLVLWTNQSSRSRSTAVPGLDRCRTGQVQYKLVRPFLFVHRKGPTLSALAQDFLGFVLSAEGQAELVAARA